MSNIIPIAPPHKSRVNRLRDCLDAFQANYDEFPRVTLALAVELYDARQELKSDQAFGAWLAENELDDLNKNDRAALIHIGECPEISRVVLELTDSRSVQRIWRYEIGPPRVPRARKPAVPAATVVDAATVMPGDIGPMLPEAPPATEADPVAAYEAAQYRIVATCVHEVGIRVRAAIAQLCFEEQTRLHDQLAELVSNLAREPEYARWAKS